MSHFEVKNLEKQINVLKNKKNKFDKLFKDIMIQMQLELEISKFETSYEGDEFIN